MYTCTDFMITLHFHYYKMSTIEVRVLDVLNITHLNSYSYYHSCLSTYLLICTCSIFILEPPTYLLMLIWIIPTIYTVTIPIQS